MNDVIVLVERDKVLRITGLRENSDRDGGIEEPYSGPSSG